MFEIKILPDNMIEISGMTIKNHSFNEKRMIGELSLCFLNYDYESVCRRGLELAERIGKLQSSEWLEISAKIYVEEVKSIISESCNLERECAVLPLAEYLGISGIYDFLKDMILNDVEDNETLGDIFGVSGETFFSEEVFDLYYFNSMKPWQNIITTHNTFMGLFDILQYSANETVIEQVQRLGIENLNDKIKQTSRPEIEYAITEHNGKVIFAETYIIGSVSELLPLEFIKMLQAGILTKRCLNCGNRFALYSGHKNNYCTKVPIGETQSCSIIGPARQFAQKAKNDPIMEIYQRIYKRIHARATRNRTTVKFDEWRREAEQIRNTAIKKQKADKLEELLEVVAEKLKL